jgi:hypothetical protein
MKELSPCVFSLDDLENHLVAGGPGPGGIKVSLDDEASIATGRDNGPTAGPHRFLECLLKIVEVATYNVP